MYCELCFNFNLYLIDANIFLNPWGFTRHISLLLITSHHYQLLGIPLTCPQMHLSPVRNLNVMSPFLHIFIIYVWILHLNLCECIYVDENDCSYSSISYIVSVQRCLQA